jgi:hypothetical protein
VDGYLFYTEDGRLVTESDERQRVVRATDLTGRLHARMTPFVRDSAFWFRLHGRLFRLTVDKSGFVLKDAFSSQAIPVGLDYEQVALVDETGSLSLTVAHLEAAIAGHGTKPDCPVYDVVGDLLGDYVSSAVRCVRLTTNPNQAPDAVALHFLDRAQLRLSLHDELYYGSDDRRSTDHVAGRYGDLLQPRPAGSVVNIKVQVEQRFVCCAVFSANGVLCQRDSSHVNKFASNLTGRCITSTVFLVELAWTDESGLVPTPVSDVVCNRVADLWRAFAAAQGVK